MPYQPHWERDKSPLRSRQDQIADEAKLDKRIPRLKKRVVEQPAKTNQSAPAKLKTFTLNH